MPEPSPDTRDIVRSLQEKIRGWERDHRPAGEMVSSGSAALDHLLADGGFCRGTLVEWLATGPGSGAATLALGVAARACCEGGALVVIDRPRMFYPPAAAGFGIDAKWLVVVRPATERDEAWALDQVLRCPGVGSVLAWPAKLTERRFRRMQLAAEAGGTLGLLVRPEQARDEPSWADVRLLVTGWRSEIGGRKSEAGPNSGCDSLAGSLASRSATGAVRLRLASEPANDNRSTLQTDLRFPTSDLRSLAKAHAMSAARRRILIELLRSRSGLTGGKVELELDELTGALYEPPAEHFAPRLAAPAARRR